MPNTLASTEEIIADLRAGKMVILVDEEDLKDKCVEAEKYEDYLLTKGSPKK